MPAIIGTPGPDRLRGTRRDDFIDGLEGDDIILGLGGDDLLAGGSGVNRLDGGSGRDAVAFRADPNDIDPTRGTDLPVSADLAAGTYAVGSEVTRLAGVEVAYGGEVDDRLAGGPGANRLFGGNGNDVLRGRGGGDHLFGGDGRNQLFGGAGNDLLEGSTFDANLLRGGDGDDRIVLGAGLSRAWGGAGADVFDMPAVLVGAGPFLAAVIRDFDVDGGDVINLPPFSFTTGNQQRYHFIGEEAFSAGGPEVRYEQRGGDTYVQYEINQGDDDDLGINELRLSSLLDLTRNDFFLGFNTTSSDDRITGTRTRDFVAGGLGDDTLRGLGDGDDLVGEGGDDRLAGGAGDDVLEGGLGRNTLVGGPGDDDLISEGGADTYVFSGDFGDDRLTDRGGRNRLVFHDLARSDVELFRDGDADLTIEVRGRSDEVTILGYYNAPRDYELVFDQSAATSVG